MNSIHIYFFSWSCENIDTAALNAGLDLISHLYVVIIIKPTFLGAKCGDVGAVMAATASQN